MIKKILFFILITLTITSCSTKRHISKQNTRTAIQTKPTRKIDIQNKENQKKLRYKPKKYSRTGIKHKLETHYNKYKAVPYKYGGTSIKGFDCSGFVQSIYKKALEIKLPRSTKGMLKKGILVSKSNLKIGDLVFFKPRNNYRHVGIFMGNHRFMYVSSSKGVTITSLKESYWRKCYFQSRRIL